MTKFFSMLKQPTKPPVQGWLGIADLVALSKSYYEHIKYKFTTAYNCFRGALPMVPVM